MATEGKPSYLSSTTSQILLGAAFAYLFGCLWVIVRGQPQEGITGLWRLFEAVFGAYAIRAGIKMGQNGGPPTSAGGMATS